VRARLLNGPLFALAVRLWFTCRRRGPVNASIRRSHVAYLRLARKALAAGAREPVRVPPMPGVDEEMRCWSFCMLLEHMAIVNRGISAIVCGLARGEKPGAAGNIDMKREVLPSPAAGPGQVAAFQESIQDHLELIPTLGSLRGTATRRHPLFGAFDAHQWHCMFAFHLQIHLRQARFIAAACGRKGGRK
jgi:hypothetical protein